MLQRIKILSFVCDHETVQPDGSSKKCGEQRIVNGARFQDIKKEGWALGAGGKCYCPNHAPFHRHVGRTGQPRKHLQLKMEDIDNGRTKPF